MANISFTATSASHAETAGTFTITAHLSATVGTDVILPFVVTGTAHSPTDYTSITASPITIPAGESDGLIVITLADDITLEAAETVIVTMGTPTGATLGANQVFTLTITASDTIPKYPNLTPLQIGNMGLTFPLVYAYNAVKKSDGTYTIQTLQIKDGQIVKVTNSNNNASAAATKTAINLLTAAYIDALV